MPTHIEPLHRGLVTSRDPSLLNEGELVFTKNARYLPGDPALHKAQSRSLVGGGGHGAPGKIVTLLGLGWDAPASPSLIYLQRSTGLLRYIPTDPNPAAAAMSNAASVQVGAIDSDATLLFPRAETVHFENTHIVLDGLHPRRVSLSAALVPQFAFLGMPRNDTPPSLIVTLSGFVGGTTSFRYYWFTWYNNTTGHEREGTTSVDAIRLAGLQPDPATKPERVLIARSIFSPARPSWATHVRIYRSAGQSPTTPSLWPSGYRVGEVAIASLVIMTGAALIAAGYTGGGSGVIVATVDYYVLLDDNLSDTILLAQPIFGKATIVVDGTPVPIGRDGAPPSAFTGDVFEESLITNDVNDPRKARYSLAGDPGHFPDLYYINLETRDRDEILSIRALGRICGVFMRNSVWRINWLPRSGDEEFARGRVRELVVEGLGVVGRHLVAAFTMPQTGAMLAWWGQNGPYATDLDGWIELAPQVNWAAVGGTPVALVNNIAAYRLEAYFKAPDGTGFIYYLHYHESQVVSGHLAVTGPIERASGVEHALAITTGIAQQLVSLPKSGDIYYESIGDAGVQMAIRTREIYLAGANNEFQTRTLLVHGEFPDAAVSWELYARPGPVTKSALLKRSAGRLSNPRVETNAEFVQVGVNDNRAASPVHVNWVGVEWGDLGEVER